MTYIILLIYLWILSTLSRGWHIVGAQLNLVEWMHEWVDEWMNNDSVNKPWKQRKFQARNFQELLLEGWRVYTETKANLTYKLLLHLWKKRGKTIELLKASWLGGSVKVKGNWGTTKGHIGDTPLGPWDWRWPWMGSLPCCFSLFPLNPGPGKRKEKKKKSITALSGSQQEPRASA